MYDHAWSRTTSWNPKTYQAITNHDTRRSWELPWSKQPHSAPPSWQTHRWRSSLAMWADRWCLGSVEWHQWCAFSPTKKTVGYRQKNGYAVTFTNIEGPEVILCHMSLFKIVNDGEWELLQETPIFDDKINGFLMFPAKFPINQPNERWWFLACCFGSRIGLFVQVSLADCVRNLGAVEALETWHLSDGDPPKVAAETMTKTC